MTRSIDRYVVYRNDNGMIVRSGQCQLGMSSYQSYEGETSIVYDLDIGESDEKMYFDLTTSAITHRPEMDTTLVGQVISGIPTGTMVEVTDEDGNVLVSQSISDGECDLSGSDTGGYTVIMRNFPFQDKFIHLEVTI